MLGQAPICLCFGVFILLMNSCSTPAPFGATQMRDNIPNTRDTPESPITRLLADVGGTNARFAWQDAANAPLSDIAVYPCANYDSLQAAIAHYLIAQHKPSPQWCAIGIANPVLGDQVQMTNHHWSFSIAALGAHLGVEQLRVINDFTALALALPALGSADLLAIGGEDNAPTDSLNTATFATKALLGPGTGLGVSGLVLGNNGVLVPISGEGGHVSLSAHDAREAGVIAWLTQRFGHASAERALSGPGLYNLYTALCALHGKQTEPLQPAQVLERAQASADPVCVDALAVFCSLLGSVAGDLALTLGARGGVYLGGGIAPRITAQLRESLFRERFVAKGRFRGYLEAIPTLVIDSRIPAALIGAARAF